MDCDMGSCLMTVCSINDTEISSSAVTLKDIILNKNYSK